MRNLVIISAIILFLLAVEGAFSLENICDDEIDNDSDNKVDCDDSDCDGEVGGDGYTCCHSDNDCGGVCWYCELPPACDPQEEGNVCYTCQAWPSSHFCDSTRLCSDSVGSGDNNYGVINFKVPSQGYCDGEGNCDYADSSPECTWGKEDGESTSKTSICVDGESTCQNACTDGYDNDNNGCRIKGKDTWIETSVPNSISVVFGSASMLKASRVNQPDVVFTKSKVAVFVDGDAPLAT